MGCDIHWFVEKQLPDGTWVRAERRIPDPWNPEAANQCRHCEGAVLTTRNPFDVLSVGPESTDAEVFESWQKLRADLGVDWEDFWLIRNNGESNWYNDVPADERQKEISDNFESLRERAELDIAYDQLKDQELRTLLSGQIFQPTCWHVESADRECGEGFDTLAEVSDGKVYDSLYSGRDYQLFGVLSDVRGVVDPEFGEIGLPGLPDDVCDQLAHEFERWGIDAHTEAHATLARLYEFPWFEKNVTQRAKIWLADGTDKARVLNSLDYYDKYASPKMPMQQIVKDLIDRGEISDAWVWPDITDEDYKMQIPWPPFPGGLPSKRLPEETADLEVSTEIPVGYSHFTHFLDTLTRMAAIAPDGDMQKVRAVWWFDN